MLSLHCSYRGAEPLFQQLLHEVLEQASTINASLIHTVLIDILYAHALLQVAAQLVQLIKAIHQQVVPVDGYESLWWRPIAVTSGQARTLIVNQLAKQLGTFLEGDQAGRILQHHPDALLAVRPGGCCCYFGGCSLCLEAICRQGINDKHFRGTELAAAVAIIQLPQ